MRKNSSCAFRALWTNSSKKSLWSLSCSHCVHMTLYSNRAIINPLQDNMFYRRFSSQASWLQIRLLIHHLVKTLSSLPTPGSLLMLTPQTHDKIGWPVRRKIWLHALIIAQVPRTLVEVRFSYLIKDFVETNLDCVVSVYQRTDTDVSIYQSYHKKHLSTNHPSSPRARHK